jgi:hypothetical protein
MELPAKGGENGLITRPWEAVSEIDRGDDRLVNMEMRVIGDRPPADTPKHCFRKTESA